MSAPPSPADRRLIRLTEPMYLVLQGIVIDATQDDPDDGEARSLLQIIRSSPLITDGWPPTKAEVARLRARLAELEEQVHADALPGFDRFIQRLRDEAAYLLRTYKAGTPEAATPRAQAVALLSIADRLTDLGYVSERENL